MEVIHERCAGLDVHESPMILGPLARSITVGWKLGQRDRPPATAPSWQLRFPNSSRCRRRRICEEVDPHLDGLALRDETLPRREVDWREAPSCAMGQIRGLIYFTQ
jgi:hypothetical protein